MQAEIAEDQQEMMAIAAVEGQKAMLAQGQAELNTQGLPQK